VSTAPLRLRGLARGSVASFLGRARRNRQDNSVNFSDDFRRCLIRLMTERDASVLRGESTEIKKMKPEPSTLNSNFLVKVAPFQAGDNACLMS